MGHYKSATPKRHTLYSNSEAVNSFDMGKLSVKAYSRGPRTTLQYKDKYGRQRFKGTSDLKQTEKLDSNV